MIFRRLNLWPSLLTSCTLCFTPSTMIPSSQPVQLSTLIYFHYRLILLYLQPVLRILCRLFIWNLALPWEYWLILNWGVCFPCNPWIIGPRYNLLPHPSSSFVAPALVNYSFVHSLWLSPHFLHMFLRSLKNLIPSSQTFFPVQILILSTMCGMVILI